MKSTNPITINRMYGDLITRKSKRQFDNLLWSIEDYVSMRGEDIMLNKLENNREEYSMWEALDMNIDLDDDSEFDEYLVKEAEEWNHPDNVAYRNRNGCEFEHLAERKITLSEYGDE